MDDTKPDTKPNADDMRRDLHKLIDDAKPDELQGMITRMSLGQTLLQLIEGVEAGEKAKPSGDDDQEVMTVAMTFITQKSNNQSYRLMVQVIDDSEIEAFERGAAAQGAFGTKH